MARDSDLEIQLEGLFADPAFQIEAEPKAELVERSIIDLLEGEIEGKGKADVEPVVTELIAGEPAALEVPSFTLAQPDSSVGVWTGEQAVLPVADFTPWETRLQEQRVRILNIMLGSLAAIGTAIILLMLVNLFREPSRRFLVYVPYLVAYMALITLTIARGLAPKLRAAGVVVLAYGIGVAVLLMEGSLSAGGLYLLAAPLLASMLIGQRAGAIAAVVSGLIYACFLLADHLGWLHPSIPYRSDVLPSVLSLIGTFFLIGGGIMFMQQAFSRTLTSALHEEEQQRDELVRSQARFMERADELGQANALLQKRALQLQTVAQVSSAATFSVIDSDKLAQQVVDLIQDRFDLYYVGLFLVDDASVDDGEQWARLQAGTGEAGHQMLAMGYKARVDASSTVGWSIVSARPRIAVDAGAIHLASTSEHVKAARLLSETRSEMAIPLRSRGRVIGALTLRSTDRAAFSQEDVPILQAMADQIAVAVDNARLFAEAQANLKELEEVQRRYVREQWDRFVSAYEIPVYERTQPGVKPLSERVLSEVEQVMAQRESVVRSDAGNGTEPAAVVVPISLRGEILGALGLQETEGERWWTDDEVALIESVVDQLALAIENARLLEETQRRAAQERVITDITAQVRASTQVDSILRTAIRELGRKLRASDGLIQLGGGDDAGSLHTDKGVVEDDGADA